MFHIKRKDKEKEKVKEKDLGKKEKDKKEKKEPMSQAELNSLDEIRIRRNIFHSGSSKRGAKKKLEISNPIPIKVVTNTELNLTNLQTEPLPNTMRQDVGQTCPSTSDKDGNEVEHNRNSVKERAAKFGELAKANSLGGPRQVSINQKSKGTSSFSTSSPSVQKRTMNSVSHPNPVRTKVHIPEVVETTFPGANLELPMLVAPSVPDSRELEIPRRNTGDFGFSLRRTTMFERQPDGGVSRRLVHFAEPGAGTKDWALGLVPGDKLVEINGVNVENKSRDEIVEMIRQSGESVRLKVQPILELSELSCTWLRSTQGLPKEIFDVSTTYCANGFFFLYISH